VDALRLDPTGVSDCKQTHRGIETWCNNPCMLHDTLCIVLHNKLFEKYVLSE